MSNGGGPNTAFALLFQHDPIKGHGAAERQRAAAQPLFGGEPGPDKVLLGRALSEDLDLPEGFGDYWLSNSEYTCVRRLVLNSGQDAQQGVRLIFFSDVLLAHSTSSVTTSHFFPTLRDRSELIKSVHTRLSEVHPDDVDKFCIVEKDGGGDESHDELSFPATIACFRLFFKAVQHVLETSLVTGRQENSIVTAARKQLPDTFFDGTGNRARVEFSNEGPNGIYLLCLRSTSKNVRDACVCSECFTEIANGTRRGFYTPSTLAEGETAFRLEKSVECDTLRTTCSLHYNILYSAFFNGVTTVLFEKEPTTTDDPSRVSCVSTALVVNSQDLEKRLASILQQRRARGVRFVSNAGSRDNSPLDTLFQAFKKDALPTAVADLLLEATRIPADEADTDAWSEFIRLRHKAGKKLATNRDVRDILSSTNQAICAVIFDCIQSFLDLLEKLGCDEAALAHLKESELNTENWFAKFSGMSAADLNCEFAPIFVKPPAFAHLSLQPLPANKMFPGQQRRCGPRAVALVFFQGALEELIRRGDATRFVSAHEISDGLNEQMSAIVNTMADVIEDDPAPQFSAPVNPPEQRIGIVPHARPILMVLVSLLIGSVDEFVFFDADFVWGFSQLYQLWFKAPSVDMIHSAHEFVVKKFGSDAGLTRQGYVLESLLRMHAFLGDHEEFRKALIDALQSFVSPKQPEFWGKMQSGNVYLGVIPRQFDNKDGQEVRTTVSERKIAHVPAPGQSRAIARDMDQDKAQVHVCRAGYVGSEHNTMVCMLAQDGQLGETPFHPVGVVHILRDIEIVVDK